MPDPGKRILAIGGGTGLAVLLRGLKAHVGGRIADLQAVVTVTDDGGSSGRLRRELGVLPPGDIRNCLVALADDEDLLARLFQYRFAGGQGLAGHSFGNLLLTALTGITGDFYQAVLTAESILSVRGRILPATLTDVRLVGRGVSGKEFQGESQIGLSGEPLQQIELIPSQVPAFEPAVEAVEQADLILLGPGSLYTSILPNLLIPGIRSAILRSSAPVVLLMNLMTQPGETDSMSGLQHFEAVERHTEAGLIDCVLVNQTPIAAKRLRHYAETGSVPVTLSSQELAERSVKTVEADLIAEDELIRHEPAKLSQAALSLITELSSGHESH